MLISIPAEQEPAFVVVVLALLIRPHPGSWSMRQPEELSGRLGVLPKDPSIKV